MWLHLYGRNIYEIQVQVSQGSPPRAEAAEIYTVARVTRKENGELESKCWVLPDLDHVSCLSLSGPVRPLRLVCSVCDIRPTFCAAIARSQPPG